MSIQSWFCGTNSGATTRNRKPTEKRQLQVERLEVRAVPASYSAATASQLIDAVNAANLSAEADTIFLSAATAFTLSAVNNLTHGPTGLPVIAAGSGSLTIAGSGSVIERSSTAGIPEFRLLDVDSGASLVVQNVTLQGGASRGPGGAIFNQGTLVITGGAVQNNVALPTDYGAAALGGGIYSAGTLTVQSTRIQNNQALGDHGFDSNPNYVDGHDAYGGGIFVAAGTARLNNVTLTGNAAVGGTGHDGRWGNRQDPEGGRGGNGGDGLGGGLYAATGSIELRSTSITGNSALGGEAGRGGSGKPRGRSGDPGVGIGGGIYIEGDVLAVLDAFTLSQCKRNKANSDPNISGSYIVG